MREGFIDTETYAAVDLRKTGVHRYAEDDSFLLLMVSWAFDNDPVRVWDYTEGPMPAELIDALHDPGITWHAHNSAFELTVLAAYLGHQLDVRRWRDSMVHAAYLGLPRSLDQLARHLCLADQKDTEGKRLIQMFSKPISAGKLKGERRLPADFPEDWGRYRAYNAQDSEVERSIVRKLAARPMPDTEWELWHLDQRINATGMRFDRRLAANAVRIDAAQVAERSRELRELTGLANPNSGPQFGAWLAEQGTRAPNLLKDTLAGIAAAPSTDTLTRKVIELRLANASKSTAKYAAMLTTGGRSDRVRGAFQFYGADTGRWAGRLVQLQNLSRNKAEGVELDALRERLRAGDGTLSSGDLKQLIRTAFVPAPGKTFLVADFSAIEARVLAWLAGETWALDAFATHGKIYEATAAAMYGIPLDDVTKDQRQKGKVAVLACGYGGSVGAMERMGGAAMGLSNEDMARVVADWRTANANIVRLWKQYERAARTAAIAPREAGRCLFEKTRGGTLYVTLPSGRKLAYPDFKTMTDDRGRDQSTYLDTTTRARIYTWGGTLTENITQAVARDLLAEAMLNVDACGYTIVGHVHDELICEEPTGASVDDLVALMCAAPAWADGLPLNAEGGNPRLLQEMRHSHPMPNNPARKFQVATAPSRFQKVWKNHTTTWPKFAERFAAPVESEEKDRGGYVAGYLRDGFRRKGAAETRSMLTLDIDYPTDDLDLMLDLALGGFAYVLHETHSSTPDAPRLRLIVPLAADLTAEEYVPAALKLMEQVGLDMFDPTTAQPERLMYWPRALRLRLPRARRRRRAARRGGAACRVPRLARLVVLARRGPRLPHRRDSEGRRPAREAGPRRRVLPRLLRHRGD